MVVYYCTVLYICIIVVLCASMIIKMFVLLTGNQPVWLLHVLLDVCSCFVINQKHQTVHIHTVLATKCYKLCYGSHVLRSTSGLNVNRPNRGQKRSCMYKKSLAATVSFTLSSRKRWGKCRQIF